MRYLLDTCVLSDFARGQAAVTARIKGASPEGLAITTVTVMEVEYGLRLNATLARKLRPVMAAFIRSVQVLAYSEDDAHSTATVRAALKVKGRPIGAYDALIAGCALARGLPSPPRTPASSSASPDSSWRTGERLDRRHALRARRLW